jgi:hypothetical protein
LAFTFGRAYVTKKGIEMISEVFRETFEKAFTDDDEGVMEVDEIDVDDEEDDEEENEDVDVDEDEDENDDDEAGAGSCIKSEGDGRPCESAHHCSTSLFHAHRRSPLM